MAARIKPHPGLLRTHFRAHPGPPRLGLIFPPRMGPQTPPLAREWGLRQLTAAPVGQCRLCWHLGETKRGVVAVAHGPTRSCGPLLGFPQGSWGVRRCLSPGGRKPWRLAHFTIGPNSLGKGWMSAPRALAHGANDPGRLLACGAAPWRLAGYGSRARPQLPGAPAPPGGRGRAGLALPRDTGGLAQCRQPGASGAVAGVLGAHTTCALSALGVNGAVGWQLDSRHPAPPASDAEVPGWSHSLEWPG